MTSTIADLAIILGQSPELSLVVKMTIAAALGLAAVRLAGAARASARHLVLTSTFAALLALPVAMVIAPAIAIELPQASAIAKGFSPSRTAAPDAGINVRAAAMNVGGRAATAAYASASTNDNRAGQDAHAIGAGSFLARMPWLAMMRAVWLAGVALLLGVLTLGLVRLRGVRRTGLPWIERRDEAMRVARESGVNRAVTVMLHESVAAPITCGWRHPVIVFPTDAREWSDGDVHRVLLHELEHVRRGDWIVQLAARAICAIYWFHPLVWTAWRQLCLEAERACDDAVVKSEAGAGCTDYAEQLVLLARRMSDAPAQPMVAMASRSDLSARVTALLDQRQRRGRAGMMTFVAAAGAAAIIVLTIGPLRAVAATEPQAGPYIARGGGSGSGDGAGHGTGHGQGTGHGAGVGSGSGAGAVSGSGQGSGANANTVIAAPGSAVGGVSGGIATGVSGGVAGGVVGGEPGAAVGGGASAGVIAGAPGAAVGGGVSGGVIGGEPGVAVGSGVPGGIAGGVPGAFGVNAAGSATEVIADDQKIIDEKQRRESVTEHALNEVLIKVASEGNLRALEEVLAAGVDVNTKVSGDGSALIAAARNGQLPAMRYLLERGADVNMGVEGDGNPLIAAAGGGHTAAVTMLLERGANIEAVVDGDENALIQAAARGRLEVVRLLVAQGANVNASVRAESNVNGRIKTEDRTPLSMARRAGHTAVVEFLQSAGALQ